MRTNIFDRLSFLLLSAVIVLLPIFCLPFTNIPVEISKGLLLVLGLALAIIFWAIARFLDGKIIFPKSWLLVSGLGVVLAFLLSALVSGISAGNSQVSLFGTMFDIGSFYFIFAGFVLMFMSSIIFRTRERVRIVLFGTILSSVFVLIFQSVHLFFPTITSLGILDDKTGNVLGSWNSLGLFAGFAGLMFLLVIEFFTISKIHKIVLLIFILFSILLIAAVNFSLVWILLGISSLIIFVYKASITLQGNEEEGKKRHFPIISFVVVMISLLFFISGPFIGNVIPNYLKISNIDVSPSIGTTMSITKQVLTKDPVFGIGPNRFTEAWSMYKPLVINNTQFWNVSFNSGSGLLPTLTATTGGLGILAWLTFFILFLIIGVKSVFSSIKDKANWEVMAFFVLSLYLFVSSFFYSTGVVIFLLALAFAGVFIGLASNLRNKEISISFLNDHRKSFFSILFLVFIIIVSAITLFKYTERFVSVSYFGKAISASTIPAAEGFIGKAISLYSNDLYLRTFSQIYLLKLNSTVSKDATSLSEEEKADLQASLDNMINGAQLATTYNPKNYINFQLLGSVYQAAGSLGVEDAYNKAIVAYQTASTLNPNNPELKLAMGGVSNILKKVQDAKDYGNAALTLKSDYIEALIFLSQIAKSEGDNASALSYAQIALSFAPLNEDLIKYVDSFKNSSSSNSSTPSDTTSKPKDNSTKKEE